MTPSLSYLLTYIISIDANANLKLVCQGLEIHIRGFLWPNQRHPMRHDRHAQVKSTNGTHKSRAMYFY